MNTLIFGRRRQGKSTLALRLAMTYHHTVFCFDPNNQYNLGEAVPVIHETEDLQEWIDNREIDHGIVIYRPRVNRQSQSLDESFADFVEVIQAKGHWGLIVDESTYLQNHARIDPALEGLMRQSPRDGARNAAGQVVDVSIIQTTHRPVDAHSICRALCSDTFLFAASLRRDIDFVEAQYGPEVAQHLTNLQRWHTVHVYADASGRQQFTIWDNPQAWHIDIEAGRRGASSATS